MNKKLYTINELVNENSKLSEKAATLEEFMKILAHDIRSPLQSIYGFSEAGKTAESLEETADYFDNINKAVKYMTEMADDLINTVSMQQGSHSVDIGAFSLAQILKKQAEIGKIFAEAKRKPIDVVYNNQLPRFCIVKTDDQILNTIIRNYVDNALKYTEQGTIEIGAVEDNGNAKIYVKDTGRGIPKAHINSVFNPNYQVNAQDKKMGFGLGLGFVKDSAEKIEAEVGVESINGKGSTFYVTVPVMAMDFKDNT